MVKLGLEIFVDAFPEDINTHHITMVGKLFLHDMASEFDPQVELF